MAHFYSLMCKFEIRVCSRLLITSRHNSYCAQAHLSNVLPYYQKLILQVVNTK